MKQKNIYQIKKVMLTDKNGLALLIKELSKRVKQTRLFVGYPQYDRIKILVLMRSVF